MRKLPDESSSVFSPAEIKRLHQLLSKRTITDFWEAGRLLNGHFGDRAPYGGLEKTEVALKTLGGNAPTSLSQLHQCRLLNDTWSKRDVAAAVRAALPWSRTIVLLYVWAKAKSQTQMGLIKRCQKLIASYPRQDRTKLKAWAVEATALQKAARTVDPSISKHRFLSEKMTASILRLKDAARIIAEMDEFLPTDAHPACLGLKGHVEGLIPLVEKLCERRMTAMSTASDT